MIFTEFRFLIFFVIVFCVHWALPNPRARKLWLLVNSYVFYGAWDWRFLSLIALSTIIDYFSALAIEAAKSTRGRQLALAVSMVMNLSLLGVFKYYNFFVESAVAILAWIGLPASPSTMAIVLPAGISFYTFQTMSYTIDVYRRELPATRDFFEFSLFVSFFPQLVAGPIVRAVDFIPQLAKPQRFAAVDVRACLVLFLVGFFKKSCVSDNIAGLVETYFAHPQGYEASSGILAIICYAIQIYCDFSGYSDMAIACAGLLGYNLCANFAHPYFATDITQFWRRWHISLSTWLRDYLYIPLGGNRFGSFATQRNLMLTMLLGGLWHGAAWRFVVWGGLHGLALIAHRQWSRRVRYPFRDKAWWHVVCGVLTFYWVCLAWIFFRAPDMESAATIMKAWVLFQSPGTGHFSSAWFALPVVLAALHWLTYRAREFRFWDRMPGWAFSLAYGGAIPVVCALMQPNAAPFIYFQF